MANFAHAALEEAALAVVGDQRQGSCVALGRFRRGPDSAQQVGARGVQQMIAVEIARRGERIDKCERRLRAVRHGDCHRAVQRHDRRGLQAFEKIIEAYDLRPVRIFGAWRLTVQGGNRRLQR
jgi:hypothetical protein